MSTGRPAGFTLIEMVITVTVIGILALGATPLLEMTAKRQREIELRTALRDIRNAIDGYRRAFDDGKIERKSGESGYPPHLESLVQGVTNIQDPSGGKLYFLRRLPRDPLNSDTSLPAAASWGKRSYASPHDAPLEGRDVFDIYSLATESGLNGVPYREW